MAFPDAMTSQIITNLHQIRLQIADAEIQYGRPSGSVLLVAVSKTHPDDAVHEAIRGSQLHFGENRMQDLEARMTSVAGDEVSWHMIGTLQSNKLKYVCQRVNWIHSAAKADHLKEIEKQAEKHNRSIRVLIQVNISGEDQKSGCNPSDLEGILEVAAELKQAQVCGLMGMAAFTAHEKTVRNQFTALRTLRERFQPHFPSLKELSMGMTHDFTWAIAEGATIVRIGSAIFGSR
jgi:pyridoxal phosphate enzyme (YggS family)